MCEDTDHVEIVFGPYPDFCVIDVESPKPYAIVDDESPWAPPPKPKGLRLCGTEPSRTWTLAQRLIFPKPDHPKPNSEYFERRVDRSRGFRYRRVPEESDADGDGGLQATCCPQPVAVR
jgi:hypothetical protein